MSEQTTRRASRPIGFLACIIIVTALQGCATSASDPQFSHKLTPTERILRLPIIPTGAKVAKVHVMRDSRFKGSGQTTTLTINGKDAVAIKSGEKIIFEIEPGEHLLGLKFLGNDPILGGIFFIPKRFIESATNFEAGKEYFFRIVDNANWEWDLKRSSY